MIVFKMHRFMKVSFFFYTLYIRRSIIGIETSSHGGIIGRLGMTSERVVYIYPHCREKKAVEMHPTSQFVPYRV